MCNSLSSINIWIFFVVVVLLLCLSAKYKTHYAFNCIYIFFENIMEHETLVGAV